MRNSTLAVLIAASMFSAQAFAQPQPFTGQATCTPTSDGGGIVTVSGVSVQRLEVYTHLPSPIPPRSAEQRDGGYYVPPGSTFNFVFTGPNGTGYVLVSNDSARASRLLVNSSTAGFNRINVMPDVQHGGIGRDGASLVCEHMDKRTPRVVQPGQSRG